MFDKSYLYRLDLLKTLSKIELRKKVNKENKRDQKNLRFILRFWDFKFQHTKCMISFKH